jgi:hypothetical protein
MDEAGVHVNQLVSHALGRSSSRNPAVFVLDPSLLLEI